MRSSVRRRILVVRGGKMLMNVCVNVMCFCFCVALGRRHANNLCFSRYVYTDTFQNYH